MIRKVPRLRIVLMLIATINYSIPAWATQIGSIRGMVYDKDFEVPLAGAQVLIAETGAKVNTSGDGNFVFNHVKPGNYTLVFSKEGYTRQVKANLVVSPGQMTEIDLWMSGEFTEMEEFVVQDVQIGTGTEAALLDLRMETPTLMSSISAELMSQAGLSDAASALKLVAGATVQDGKYAVIRGLPDRYVNSQMNSVRLPTADADKRAVQLDQFPSSVIESIQVSKTFTPDQQGDASGGAVNVVLKGIPEETFLSLKSSTSWNSQVKGDFLSYKGGGVNTWGMKTIDPQVNMLNRNWTGAAGVSDADNHMDYKWSVSGGGKFNLSDDVRVGGFGTIFYDRDSSYSDDGINDKYWVPGTSLNGKAPYRMVPKYSNGLPTSSNWEDHGQWKTSLFDVTKASQSVQWGGLGIVGLETENHELKFLYMYTRDTTDKVTLAENTRGRETMHIYWPDHYPEIKFDEPMPDGYNPDASLPIRNQTLEYTERTTETFQFSGKHNIDYPDFGIKNFFMFKNLEFDWTVARSSATLYQPDKRLLSVIWNPYKGGKYWPNNFGGDTGSTGNFYRIWKDIAETSDQFFMNFKVPFEQWTGDEGYLKFGIFSDRVSRTYEQDTFYNQGDNSSLKAGWDVYWSDWWSRQNHRIIESRFDVDYKGMQNISAWYYMMDLPLTSNFKFIGGIRHEKTKLGITNYPDLSPAGQPTAKLYYWRWTEEGNVNINYAEFNKADSDVDYKQVDTLPSLGFEFKPWDSVVLRGAYTETIARQTFKELSPISQQEFVGGDIFVGNPGLKMSSLKNYDLRLDWTPYDGGLLSVSYFYKDIKNPIEYVQIDDGTHSFISVVNYPEGKLSGYEFEIKQDMGRLWSPLEGLNVGANATFIDSEVSIVDGQLKSMRKQGIPTQRKRDMVNAPEHLYNIYLTYDLKETDTRFALFYNVRGDTLVAGAGGSAKGFIPDVYETEYGTLNLSVTQKLWDNWKFKFQVKNLLNPEIKSVYRSGYIGGDVTKTSYKKGIDFSISLVATF